MILLLWSVAGWAKIPLEPPEHVCWLSLGYVTGACLRCCLPRCFKCAQWSFGRDSLHSRRICCSKPWARESKAGKSSIKSPSFSNSLCKHVQTYSTTVRSGPSLFDMCKANESILLKMLFSMFACASKVVKVQALIVCKHEDGTPWPLQFLGVLGLPLMCRLAQQA